MMYTILSCLLVSFVGLWIFYRFFPALRIQAVHADTRIQFWLGFISGAGMQLGLYCLGAWIFSPFAALCTLAVMTPLGIIGQWQKLKEEEAAIEAMIRIYDNIGINVSGN